MTDGSESNASTKRQIWAAFKMVYMLTFVIAIFDVIKIGLTNIPDYTPPHVKELSTVNVLLWQLLLAAFLVVVSFHLVRVYATLECLEKEWFNFETFYESFSNPGLRFEFFLRFLIVAVITLKALSPITGNAFVFVTHPVSPEANAKLNVFYAMPIFLIALYTALVFWSVWAKYSGKKSFEDAFFRSSVIGFVGAIAAWFLLDKDNLDNYVFFVLLLLFIVIVGLGRDLCQSLVYIWKNNYVSKENFVKLLLY